MRVDKGIIGTKTLEETHAAVQNLTPRISFWGKRYLTLKTGEWIGEYQLQNRIMDIVKNRPEIIIQKHSLLDKVIIQMNHFKNDLDELEKTTNIFTKTMLCLIAFVHQIFWCFYNNNKITRWSSFDIVTTEGSTRPTFSWI